MEEEEEEEIVVRRGCVVMVSFPSAFVLLACFNLSPHIAYLLASSPPPPPLSTSKYGNSENSVTAHNKSLGAGAMEAIYFGQARWQGNGGDGDGPWVGADLEAGMYVVFVSLLSFIGRCTFRRSELASLLLLLLLQLLLASSTLLTRGFPDIMQFIHWIRLPLFLLVSCAGTTGAVTSPKSTSRASRCRTSS